MKLVIGITGSTGVIYGIRMLETLKKLDAMFFSSEVLVASDFT